MEREPRTHAAHAIPLNFYEAVEAIVTEPGTISHVYIQ